MHSIKNFSDWRNMARQLIIANVPPEEITWSDGIDQQQSLFTDYHSGSAVLVNPSFKISQAFIDLAEIVALHHNTDKWALLYQALWRLTHGEKFLLNVSSDALINKLLLYKKAITRDAHKMKAFVRFRCHKENDNEYYLAWYQPDHLIVRWVSGFFKKRFAVLRWTIMAPVETVSWDGKELIFSKGVPTKLMLDDNIESLWCTYYRAIFNPARIKTKAMLNEMPARYWHTMPETQLIPAMLKEAPARAAKMLKENEGLKFSAADFFSSHMDLSQLEKAAATCQACHLYACARQTVFGKGPSHSQLMLIGEQPGLQEDKEGIPFIGPAGLLLREIMAEIDLDINTVYVTNVVKHFKHSEVAGKQLHRSPDVREVNACKPWVEKQISLVGPKVIVCLGNIAAKALIAPGFTMHKDRGHWYRYHDRPILGTFHPAAILRMFDPEKKISMRHQLKSDLQLALQRLN